MISDENTRTNLLLKNILVIEGLVDEEMLKYVREAIFCLMARGNPDITAYLSGPGGNLNNGLQIYGLIKNYPGKTTAIVTDKIESSAVYILQAFDKITGYPWSVYHIHFASLDFTTKELRKKKVVEKKSRDLERLQKLADQTLVTRTGHSIREIERQYDEDTLMNAQEALEFGIIDEILAP